MRETRDLVSIFSTISSPVFHFIKSYWNLQTLAAEEIKSADARWDFSCNVACDVAKTRWHLMTTRSTLHGKCSHDEIRYERLCMQRRIRNRIVCPRLNSVYNLGSLQNFSNNILLGNHWRQQKSKTKEKVILILIINFSQYSLKQKYQKSIIFFTLCN